MEILIIIGSIVFLGVFEAVCNHYRMKKIAKYRGKPDICSYARSFDYRKTDTKIMREAFNSVQDWAGKYEGIPFPVKAEDCFKKLYNMAPDDLDDIYFEIAEKLNINIVNPETNPYWNKVNTVKDLVMFLHFQKKVQNV